MSELVKRVPPADGVAQTQVQRAGKKPRTRKVLELVASRGRDVIGVRHLLEGGAAWVGDVNDAIARVPMKDYGDHPVIVGEVKGRAYTLYVPPRARARLHVASGVPRILAGPQKITLDEGDRAVLVIGTLQIRAQVVTIEVFSNARGVPAGAAGWIAFVAAVYLAALAVCAALTPPPAETLEGGSMQRVHEDVIEKMRGL